MMAIFQKVDDGERNGSPHPRPDAQPREGGEARPKVELVVGDFNDPASLKPAFASVDEAFVVVNGKDLNRLEANALDRSRAFKRLRFRWPQRERGVGDEERQFLENGVGLTCASAVWVRSLAPPSAWKLADQGLSFLNDQGISPSNEGQQDGIKLAAFFGREIFVNPRRLPRRHFLQHPKADHFLQPRGEQRFRQTQRRLDFSISAKLEETLIQYQKGPTVPDHRQCFAQGRGLLGQSVPLHRPSPRVDSLSLESVGGSPG
jgi:hypothetical protein